MVRMSPRTATSRASELKYEAILDAALELFVERGFHGTAVPAVAERAGVGAGTIYRYFDSKEALVNVLYRHWKERLAGTVLAAFPQGASAREQFHAIWTRLATFVTAHPKAFAFLELHHHRDYLDAESLAIESRLVDFASGFIEHAQRAGVLVEGSPQLVMALVYGAFTGVIRAGWEGRIELSDEHLQHAEQMCWSAVAK
jgi:AcrR family transcriptional regulator